MVLLAFLLPTLAGCGGSGGVSGDGADGGERTVTVFAASSLTAAFEAIGEEFEVQNEGVSVEFNFAGSSELAGLIQEGAPADVFASADLATMDKLATDLLDATPADFATNTLQIVVPPGNPAGITSIADLARADVALVTCAPEVPCGVASLAVAEAAGVVLSPVSEEQSVTDVLGKVTSGEADAGLVYVTDVNAAGDAAEGIAVPEAAEAVNTYPIVRLAGAADTDLAQTFVDLVLGSTGQAILADAGFAPAP